MHTLTNLLLPVWRGQQPLAPALEEGQRLITQILQQAAARSSAQR